MNDPNDFFPDYKLGIKPITGIGDRPPTFDEMRAEIEQGGRDSHLIRGALETARYRGLSGEDTYVLIAYQALIHLEDTHKRLMRMVSLTPNPTPMLIPTSEIDPALLKRS